MNYNENPVDHSEKEKLPSNKETVKPTRVNVEWFGNPSQSKYTVIFIPGILDPSNDIAQSFYENLGGKIKIASMGLKYNEQQAFNLDNVITEITAEVTKYNKPSILVGYSVGALLSLQVAKKLSYPPLGALLIGPCIDDESVKHGFIKKLKKHPTTMERLLKVAIKARGMLQPTSTKEEQYALNQIKAVPSSTELPNINYPVVVAFAKSDRYINQTHVAKILNSKTDQYRSLKIPTKFVSNKGTGVIVGHQLDPDKYSQLNQEILIPEITSFIPKSQTNNQLI